MDVRERQIVTIVVKHFEWPKMARKKEETSVNVAHLHTAQWNMFMSAHIDVRAHNQHITTATTVLILHLLCIVIFFYFSCTQ